MEPTIERKIALLGQELRELIELNNHRFICDDERKIYEYVWEHVKSWIAKNYPEQSKYSDGDIGNLIIKILEYVVRERFLLRDSDFDHVVYDDNRTSSLDEANTHETQDGARSYAKSFRDNGQFGSYPIHDDYSEEGDL